MMIITIIIIIINMINIRKIIIFQENPTNDNTNKLNIIFDCPKVRGALTV